MLRTVPSITNRGGVVKNVHQRGEWEQAHFAGSLFDGEACEFSWINGADRGASSA
jgi:hypothetical protein